MVAIISGQKKPVVYQLETETDELDFLRGRFPTKYRLVQDTEDLSQFVQHQIKWRPKKKEEAATVPENLVRLIKGKKMVAVKVPIAFDGIRTDDQVAMVLGGSGDRYAYAISKAGFDLVRVAPDEFKARRIERDKKNDHLLLVNLVKDQIGLFQPMSPRDMELVKLRDAYFQRQDAMKARMAGGQRLRQRVIGRVFLADNLPEGEVNDVLAEIEAAEATDPIFLALQKEENRREAELKKLVREFDVYKTLFEPIEGCGEMTAARLIVAVGDVRRFPTVAAFKAFCGVHTLRGKKGKDGKLMTDDPCKVFPRQRQGQVADWQPEARQAFYLLGEQFSYRPDSFGGQELRRWKEVMRERHPDKLCQKCGCPVSECSDPKGKEHKSIYSDGHIHKMASWRTLTKFAERLYRDWRALYKDSVDASDVIEEAADEKAA
jgi:transposase